MFKKTLLAATVALTLAWAAPASADTILFDPDGAGGAFSPIAVNQFDMAPGNSIAVDANALSPAGHTFNAYYQANLAAVLGLGVSYTNNQGGTGPSFTVVAAFGEQVIANVAIPGAQIMAFDFAAGGDNFFEIWVQNDPQSDLDGVCFVCGTLIMSGHIIGYNSPATFAAFTAQAPTPLDSAGLVPGDQYPEIDSLRGSGSFDIQIAIDSYDKNYFPDVAPGLVIGLASADGTTTIPFDATDPSRCFHATGGGYNAADAPPAGDRGNCLGPRAFDGATLASLGPVNGLGPNTQFETDANLTFQLIPEPASLTLLGLGLLGSAGAARRRRRQAQAAAQAALQA